MSSPGVPLVPSRRTGLEPGHEQAEPDPVYDVRVLLPVVYRREHHRELLGRVRYVRQAAV